jgi:hypothetical protein
MEITLPALFVQVKPRLIETHFGILNSNFSQFIFSSILQNSLKTHSDFHMEKCRSIQNQLKLKFVKSNKFN